MKKVKHLNNTQVNSLDETERLLREARGEVDTWFASDLPSPLPQTVNKTQETKNTFQPMISDKTKARIMRNLPWAAAGNMLAMLFVSPPTSYESYLMRFCVGMVICIIMQITSLEIARRMMGDEKWNSYD